MLIQALCEYYDVLAAQGKVIAEEFSSVNIHYLVSLTPDGKVDGIIDWRKSETTQQKGKDKEVLRPRSVSLPRRTEKSGIEGNIVEHRPLYLFGLNYDAKTETLTPDDRTGKAKKSHDAFVQRNLSFFEGLEDPVCTAFQSFMRNWNPAEEVNNPHLLQLGKNLMTSGFGFCLSGRPDLLLHENFAVREKAKADYIKRAQSNAGNEAQCGILGEQLPIARIHDKIRGVPGGSSMGNTLISFNNSAEYSYGHDQSFNSNVSERAMKHYTQALNYLMSSPKHRTMIDDVTILHWAASDNERCDDLLNMLLFSDRPDPDQIDLNISRFLHSAREGSALVDTEELLRNIDPKVRFYVVGVKPNSARLAVKFIYRQSFGKIVENLLMHQRDLCMSEENPQIPLWRIRKELVSPKSSNEKIDPSAMEKILDAAINGYVYPGFLLQTVLRRIRKDSDDENNSFIKMNDTRMGILKACINRENRRKGQKEEITMALDESNVSPAYLCGRLFAVLENIQQRASNYSLNRTIKDAYFASASVRPAIVFPKLLALAQHHMAKLENGHFADRQISEITALLGTEFPSTLSLKEQGVFMLGYYQQKESTTQKIKMYKEKQEEK